MDHDKNNIIKIAVKSTLPILFGYIPISMTFGFLFTQSGYQWWYAVIMSVFIYSGATQFLTISFFNNFTPLPEVIFVSFLLNIRHSVFGLSLLKKFTNTSHFKHYLIFALTDETYALFTNIDDIGEKDKKMYYFYISVLNHSYWIIGTFLGALLGNIIKFNLKGVGFVLTALFVVLTVEQYKKLKYLKPFIIAIIVGILSLIFIPSKYILLISIILGIILLSLLRGQNNED